MKSNMQRRMSVSINEETDKKIIEMKKTDEYCRCSYSEIIRKLIEEGIKTIEANKEGAQQ